jgi:hypothetical protein
VTSRNHRIGSALLKCPSKPSSLEIQFRIPPSTPARTSAPLPSRSHQSLFYYDTKVQIPKSIRPIPFVRRRPLLVTCWIVFHMRIANADNLYWQRVYLFSISYQTPAATTFLSRQSLQYTELKPSTKANLMFMFILSLSPSHNQIVIICRMAREGREGATCND